MVSALIAGGPYYGGIIVSNLSNLCMMFPYKGRVHRRLVRDSTPAIYYKETTFVLYSSRGDINEQSGI